MRLATFEINGTRRLGLIHPEQKEKILDLALASSASTRLHGSGPALATGMMELIESHAARQELKQWINLSAVDGSLAEAFIDRRRVRLCAPLERPGKLICLAGNYREHITESGYQALQQNDVITPQLFLKPATCLVGDGEDIQIGKNNVAVGWEVELAVIIGKRGKNIEAQRGLEYVFGYTLLNDISERRLNSRMQNRRAREADYFFDWLAGKWFDSFAPCGPWIVTADEIADPHQLEIRLSVNDQIRQLGNTCEMIFSIPQIIAYTSSIMTLEPGDMISTGTPAGAGIGGEAQLRDGDVVVGEIEQIGKLMNRVRSIS